MSINQVVSGVGANSKRTDQNISERVQKIQREAKIENATGGTYAQAKTNKELAQGASTNVPTPSPMMARPAASLIEQPRFDQMNPNPGAITDGAPGNTDGRQPEELPNPVDAPDNNALIARAIFMLDPTPQNRRNMESFMVEGRNG
jgi:hypothetical protein